MRIDSIDRTNRIGRIDGAGKTNRHFNLALGSIPELGLLGKMANKLRKKR